MWFKQTNKDATQIFLKVGEFQFASKSNVNTISPICKVESVAENYKKIAPLHLGKLLNPSCSDLTHVSQ